MQPQETLQTGAVIPVIEIFHMQETTIVYAYSSQHVLIVMQTLHGVCRSSLGVLLPICGNCCGTASFCSVTA